MNEWNWMHQIGEINNCSTNPSEPREPRDIIFYIQILNLSEPREPREPRYTLFYIQRFNIVEPKEPRDTIFYI